jgi:hypothetical protein
MKPADSGKSTPLLAGDPCNNQGRRKKSVTIPMIVPRQRAIPPLPPNMEELRRGFTGLIPFKTLRPGHLPASIDVFGLRAFVPPCLRASVPSLAQQKCASLYRGRRMKVFGPFLAFGERFLKIIFLAGRKVGNIDCHPESRRSVHPVHLSAGESPWRPVNPVQFS